MKKKILSVLVACLMVFSITSCGTPQPNNNSDDTIAVSDSENNSEDDSSDENTESTEPTEEEKAKLEKERQESLTIYADMINEIQTDIPELTVSYIVGTNDGGKDMTIHMPLLESKDATTYKMAELTTTKETLLNNNGITDITIYVENNGESAGIVMFSNEGGSYEPIVNTL